MMPSHVPYRLPTKSHDYKYRRRTAAVSESLQKSAPRGALQVSDYAASGSEVHTRFAGSRVHPTNAGRHNPEVGIIARFVEAQLSSRRARQREQILQTIEELPAGDRLVVSQLSRMGRSLGQIIQAVDQLLKNGVSLIAIKESIRLEGKQDLQTKVTIALFGLFAEIERDLTSERTKEGLAAARARGGLLGRPKGWLGPSKLDGKEGEIQMLLGKKVSKASIAKILDVAPSTLHPFIQSRRLEPKKRRQA
jgi:DNA invertase Pin-like site-specific DNA recombinase